MSLAVPDVADRHRRYLALEMLAIAVLSLANAAQRIVPADLVRATEHVQTVMGVLVVAGLIPMALWKLRNRDAELRQLYLSEDGFVAQTLTRAQISSWVVTFVLLALMSPLSRRFETVPAAFYVYVTMAVMTGVFGGVFLFLDRAAEDGDPDEPADA